MPWEFAFIHCRWPWATPNDIRLFGFVWFCVFLFSPAGLGLGTAALLLAPACHLHVPAAQPLRSTHLRSPAHSSTPRLCWPACGHSLASENIVFAYKVTEIHLTNLFPLPSSPVPPVPSILVQLCVPSLGNFQPCVQPLVHVMHQIKNVQAMQTAAITMATTTCLCISFSFPAVVDWK